MRPNYLAFSGVFCLPIKKEFIQVT